ESYDAAMTYADSSGIDHAGVYRQSVNNCQEVEKTAKRRKAISSQEATEETRMTAWPRKICGRGLRPRCDFDELQRLVVASGIGVPKRLPQTIFGQGSE